MAEVYLMNKRESEDGFAVETHLHDTFELNFILTEGAEIMVEDQVFVSQKGTVCIFPPFSLHKIRCEGMPYHRYVINFNEFQVTKMCSALEPAIAILKSPLSSLIMLSEEDTATLISLFQTAYEERSSNSPLNNYRKVSALGDILYFLLPLLEEDKQTIIQKNEIADILTYINDHIQEDITVESIAKHFGMSSTTLWRLIKKNTWISPKEYILKKRLVVASDLLMYGASVAEAAEKSGFNSYSHFIRTFTQQRGISPHKYVQKMLQT